MGKEKEKKEAAPEKKGGCMRWLLALSLLLLVVLGGFTWLTFDPQELSDIDGYRETSSLIPPPYHSESLFTNTELRMTSVELSAWSPPPFRDWLPFSRQ